jgi:hypothetical protein
MVHTRLLLTYLGLKLNDFAKEKLRITTDELQQEKTTVNTIIENRKSKL